MQEIQGITKVSHLHVQNISSAPTRMLKGTKDRVLEFVLEKKNRLPVSWNIEKCGRL